MSRSTHPARIAGAAALGVAAVGAGGLLYAYAVEPKWLEVTRTTVRIPGLPAPLRGLRIALLADLHLGHGTSARLLRRACRLAMREAPDVIALAGDFVSAEGTRAYARARLPEVMALLDAGLRAPLGVYAVPGNHDNDAGAAAWHRALAATSITDLTDRFVTRDVGGARLRLAGLDDVGSGHPHPARALPDDAADCTVLLAHNPDQVEQAQDRIGRADLVLSGHTHGGQIRLPFKGAVVNSAEHADLYEWGLVRRPWTQVYVSRGVGTVHERLRFLCRPEVAVLELSAD